MFNETQTVDIRSVAFRVRIRTIPESEPDDDWKDPIRTTTITTHAGLPWPSHEDELDELEEEPTQYQALSGSVLTTRGLGHRVGAVRNQRLHLLHSLAFSRRVVF